MHAYALVVGGVGSRAQRIERPDDAAVPVVSVLQEQGRGEREVKVVARPHSGGDLLWRHHAGRGGDLLDLHPGHSRRAGPLI